MAISEELKAANTEFYRALESMLAGDVTPMENIWSHADDVSYLGPAGGFLKGWDEVFKSWKHLASLVMKGDVKPSDLHFMEEGNIGIIQCIETGIHHVNGKSETVNIRATNVFRKENGKWKMITHQTDLWDFQT